MFLNPGKSWFEAKLDEQDIAQEPRHYGWTIWSAELKVPDDKNELEIWSKAVDSSYNVQPESFENIWNLRGLLSNAYFRLKLKTAKNDLFWSTMASKYDFLAFLTL